MAGGATTLRDALLPVADAIRGLPYILGMRLYTVQVQIVTWSGTRFGLGTKTIGTLQPIKVAAGSAQLTVRQVTQKDIIASGGLYQDLDLIVGPITPPYVGSSKDDDQISIFDPAVTMSTPTQVFFFVTGPGYSSGAWFKKAATDVSKPLHYTFVIRKTAETP
jgi:hypothetical protein